MRNLLLTCLAAAVLGSPVASAAINIPSDGSDGELVITANTEIDLSQAPTGNWDANNNANAGKGIYDSNKWAVVFKYSAVTVNAGTTVTFKNHASRAPVVWLVSGDVTINGTVDVSGGGGRSAPALAEPGPGGFRGSMGYLSSAGSGAGFGMGGENPFDHGSGTGGKYGSGATRYGNPSLMPVLGGSGGGSVKHEYARVGGGAGGGALLIACAHTIRLEGSLLANGGAGVGQWVRDGVMYYSEGGSGGGIRVVAETLTGNGVIRAIGGSGGVAAGIGRIRIERVATTGELQATPDPSVVALAAASVPAIWLPETGPMAKIVSVGGAAAPADPRSGFGAAGADVTLPQITTTPVVVETTNVERASLVKVRTTPRANGNYTETTATVDQVVSETPLVIRWKATVPVNNGYSAMQVRVIRP